MSRSTFEAVPRALDSNGNPVSGGLLYVYLAGSTTAAITYSDEDLTTPHTQPIVSDASGVFPQVYAAQGSYKYVIKTAGGVTLQEADNVVQGEAGLLPIPSVPDLLANTSLSYTTGNAVVEGDIVRTDKEGTAYEVAASDATDYDTITAGGVKLNRVPNPTETLTSQAISDTPHAVKLDHLPELPQETFVANPADTKAAPIPIKADKALGLLGFGLTTGTAEEWSLKLPQPDGRTVIKKGGRIEIPLGNATYDVDYAEPFPLDIWSNPVLTPHRVGSDIFICHTVLQTDKAKGFTIYIWQWDSGTNDWITPTVNTFVTWEATGE